MEFELSCRLLFATNKLCPLDEVVLSPNFHIYEILFFFFFKESFWVYNLWLFTKTDELVDALEENLPKNPCQFVVRSFLVVLAVLRQSHSIAKGSLKVMTFLSVSPE